MRGADPQYMAMASDLQERAVAEEWREPRCPGPELIWGTWDGPFTLTFTPYTSTTPADGMGGIYLAETCT